MPAADTKNLKARFEQQMIDEAHGMSEEKRKQLEEEFNIFKGSFYAG